ncbi:MAG: hypothetical protein LBC17_03090 [Lactobacillaceae bacterium]|nr:hypothetical protein [Lactobacillaceae bacterium]
MINGLLRSTNNGTHINETLYKEVLGSGLVFRFIKNTGIQMPFEATILNYDYRQININSNLGKFIILIDNSKSNSVKFYNFKIGETIKTGKIIGEFNNDYQSEKTSIFLLKDSSEKLVPKFNDLEIKINENINVEWKK